jgi:hypothetical protein
MVRDRFVQSPKTLQREGQVVVRGREVFSQLDGALGMDQGLFVMVSLDQRRGQVAAGIREIRIAGKRDSVVPFGIGEGAEMLKNRAQVVMSWSVFGLDRNRRAIAIRRRRHFSLGLQNGAQIVVRAGIARRNADRASEALLCAVEVSLLKKRSAQQGVRVWVIGREEQKFLKMACSLGQIALLLPKQTQVRVRRTQGGLELERLLVCAHGATQIAYLAKAFAEADVKARLGAVRSNGSFNQFDPGLGLSACDGNSAQLVQSMRMVRFDLQDLAVNRFRLGQFTVLMVPRAQREKLCNIGHGLRS